MSIVLITHDLGVVAEMCDSNYHVRWENCRKTNVDNLFHNPRSLYKAINGFYTKNR